MKKYYVFIIVTICFSYGQIVVPKVQKIQSLALPGYGEFSLGYKNRAHKFFIIEAALWLCYLRSNKYHHLYKKDYQAFAELHAGVIDMSNKDYLFAVNVGHFDSFNEFNEVKLRQRNTNEIYLDQHENWWLWNSKKNRIRYDQMRINSQIYKKISYFSISGLILNRIISFIDVVYLENNNRISFQSSFDIDETKAMLLYKF